MLEYILKDDCGTTHHNQFCWPEDLQNIITNWLDKHPYGKIEIKKRQI